MRLRLLSATDLAVTKVGRFQDHDRQDIGLRLRLGIRSVWLAPSCRLGRVKPIKKIPLPAGAQYEQTNPTLSQQRLCTNISQLANEQIQDWPRQRAVQLPFSFGGQPARVTMSFGNRA